MFRIDNATSAGSLPTPGAVGPNPDSYFTEGDPGLAVPATVVSADWLNALQEEIAYAIEQNGGTLDKTNRTQLKAAIDAACAAAAGSAASQAEMETGTATNRYVSPGRQHFHPRHIKKIVKFPGAGSDGTIATSISLGGTARAERQGSGYYRCLWSTTGSGDDMSSGTYSVIAFTIEGSAPTTVGSFGAAITSTISNIAIVSVTAQDATGVTLKCEGSAAGSSRDPSHIVLIVMGDTP